MENYVAGDIVTFEQDGFGSIEGRVVFVDSQVAIVEVKRLERSAFPLTMFYNEVMNRYPGSCIAEPADLSQLYLCIDVENNISAHFYNCLTGSIGDVCIDEEMEMLYDNEEEEYFPDAPMMHSNGGGIDESIDIDLPMDFLDEMMSRDAIREYEDSCDVQVNVDEVADDSSVISDDCEVFRPAQYGINRAVAWLSVCDCAILTAWRSAPGLTRAQKNEDNARLLGELRNHGYGVSKVRGCYVAPDYPLSKENSFFVCNINNDRSFFDTIFALSESFGQECFLYKEGGSLHPAYLIGTNDKFGKGKMVIAGRMHIGKDSSPAFTEIGNGRISFD